MYATTLVIVIFNFLRMNLVVIVPAPMVSSGVMIISYDPLSINRCVTCQYLESNGNTPIEKITYAERVNQP